MSDDKELAAILNEADRLVQRLDAMPALPGDVHAMRRKLAGQLDRWFRKEPPTPSAKDDPFIRSLSNERDNYKALWDQACEQIAAMCEFVGADPLEPPDAWTLRDYLVRWKADRDRMGQEKDEAIAKVVKAAEYHVNCSSSVLGHGRASSSLVALETAVRAYRTGGAKAECSHCTAEATCSIPMCSKCVEEYGK